jgi:DNA-binding NarL/FixJ family response regulator
VESRVIRVLVVDHNPLMREGLALLVRMQPDMQLVGTAATAEESVRMYLEQRPDLTLMDLDMASHAALGAIRKIRAHDPGARIIGLATYERDATWTEALAAARVSVRRQERVERRPPGPDSQSHLRPHALAGP